MTVPAVACNHAPVIVVAEMGSMRKRPRVKQREAV